MREEIRRILIHKTTNRRRLTAWHGKGAIISEDILERMSPLGGRNKKNSSTDEKEEFLARGATRETERMRRKCEIVEEGCLVCEGLAEGTYRVTNVKDLNEEEVSGDGTSISCDEADVETFDDALE